MHASADGLSSLEVRHVGFGGAAENIPSQGRASRLDVQLRAGRLQSGQDAQTAAHLYYLPHRIYGEPNAEGKLEISIRT
jgi:hypothetical protein